MILNLIKSSVIISFGAAAIFGLWIWNSAPGGTFNASWSPGKESPFIYGFGPAAALAESADPTNFQIKGERATFSLKLPTDFKQIEMEIAYDKPSFPIFELLGKSGIGAIDYQKRVLYSEIREKGDGAAPLSTLGFKIQKNLGNGTAHNRRIGTTLRGSHIFWLLPGGRENNEITFSVQDMNRHPDTDPITIEVSSRDKVLKKITFDDNEDDSNNLPGELRDIKIFLPKVSGALRVHFSASDDIFIRSLESDAARLVVEDRIFLGDDVGFGGQGAIPTLWSNGSYLRAKTPHREGMQKITFANREMEIVRTDKYKTIALGSSPGGIIPIRVQKNDVELLTSGFFAFSPDDFFTPTWPELSWADNWSEATSIVAKYAPPEPRAGLLISKVKFSADELLPERSGSYRFFFSLPGAEELGGSVRIRQIKVIGRK